MVLGIFPLFFSHELDARLDVEQVSRVPHRECVVAEDAVGLHQTLGCYHAAGGGKKLVGLPDLLLARERAGEMVQEGAKLGKGNPVVRILGELDIWEVLMSIV